MDRKRYSMQKQIKRKLISNKIHFKTKNMKKVKEGYYIIIMGSIQKEAITVINLHSNIGTLKYMKQILMDIKRKIHSTTIIEDFNTPLTSMDRSSTQKIRKLIRK